MERIAHEEDTGQLVFRCQLTGIAQVLPGCLRPGLGPRVDQRDPVRNSILLTDHRFGWFTRLASNPLLRQVAGLVLVVSGVVGVWFSGTGAW